MDQFSTFYWKKIIISSKTSLDRLKLIYKTKKKDHVQTRVLTKLGLHSGSTGCHNYFLFSPLYMLVFIQEGWFITKIEVLEPKWGKFVHGEIVQFFLMF
jgi:hypothetical protein